MAKWGYRGDQSRERKLGQQALGRLENQVPLHTFLCWQGEWIGHGGRGQKVRPKCRELVRKLQWPFREKITHV